MNSAELLHESKRIVTGSYEAVYQCLKKAADAKQAILERKEPRVVERAAPADFSCLSLLRVGGAKGVSTFAIGSTDPGFAKAWADAFPPVAPAGSAPPAPGSPPPPKSLEFELARSLFQAVEPELKAMGVAIDPKTTFIQEGASLGGWAKLQVESTIAFPFGTKAGELLLEMPVFDMAFARDLTRREFGFDESVRILVVDDSMVSRKNSRLFLAMAGYFNVDESPDGQAALTKLVGSRPPFGLVVADWHMPVMSGIDLLRRIRADEQIKRMPVILATGEKNKDEVMTALREGATGYLVKPLEPVSFFKSLKKAGSVAGGAKPV